MRDNPSVGPDPGPDPAEALQHPDRRGVRGSVLASCCITTIGTPVTSGQNQAKSAVLFLYKEVLGEPLPWLEGIESAKRPERLPLVLTRKEVKSILTHLSGTVAL